MRVREAEPVHRETYEVVRWDGTSEESSAIIDWVRSFPGEAAYPMIATGRRSDPRIGIESGGVRRLLNPGGWLIRAADQFFTMSDEQFSTDYRLIPDDAPRPPEWEA